MSCSIQCSRHVTRLVYGPWEVRKELTIRLYTFENSISSESVVVQVLYLKNPLRSNPWDRIPRWSPQVPHTPSSFLPAGLLRTLILVALMLLCLIRESVEWLRESFGLDLSQICQCGGHSRPRTHRIPPSTGKSSERIEGTGLL